MPAARNGGGEKSPHVTPVASYVTVYVTQAVTKHMTPAPHLGGGRLT